MVSFATRFPPVRSDGSRLWGSEPGPAETTTYHEREQKSKVKCF